MNFVSGLKFVKKCCPGPGSLRRFWSGIILVFLVHASVGALLAAPGSEKNVLVLHSYHKGLSWTEKVVDGIDSVFESEKSLDTKVRVFYEYMDSKRFEDPAYQELLIPLLKYKARRVHYDLIIAVDDAALHFLLKHRDEIFGDPVPVVFCGVNFYSPELLHGEKNYTGVVEAFAAKDTIDLALKFHPQTKEFVVVGDDSGTSRANNKVIQSVEGDYTARGIRFRYLTDAHIEEYRREIEKLESGSVVLAMLFNRDAAGRFYTYEEAFDRYAGLAQVPVYTYWDFYIGRGAIGGRIISGRAQGEAAARIAVRILDGVSIDDIPVVTESPNKYIFDYRELARAGITLSDLPRGSKIINEPVTLKELYEQYRSYVFGVLSLVIFLLIVIIVLVVNIRRRIRSEQKLTETNKAYYRFVPREFLDHMKKADIMDVMPGDAVKYEMSILFSDIRDFTTLSENMTPEENFGFINSYLTTISPAIHNNGGFIDKFIGDAIMALFPGDPENVVRAALEMSNRLMDFNIDRQKRGRAPIAIGIGIHRGDVMLGTVGEAHRMDGTVISDAVNLASRLESLTKMYGARIIVSEQVITSLGDKADLYLRRYLGRVNVKGKNRPTTIFEMIEGRTTVEKEEMVRSRDQFEKAVSLLEKGQTVEARELLMSLQEDNPRDGAVKYLLSRSAGRG